MKPYQNFLPRLWCPPRQGRQVQCGWLGVRSSMVVQPAQQCSRCTLSHCFFMPHVPGSAQHQQASPIGSCLPDLSSAPVAVGWNPWMFCQMQQSAISGHQEHEKMVGVNWSWQLCMLQMLCGGTRESDSTMTICTHMCL
jgi:hypothetical protein